MAVEEKHPPLLAEAYDIFTSLPARSPRKNEFAAFRRKQGWWLDQYAYFRVLQDYFQPCFQYNGIEHWDSELADMRSKTARDFLATRQDRLAYYEYVQMENYRQGSAALDYAHKQGIEEIEAMVGVGIAKDSAEGFLMRKLFSFMRQIGCFPEPDNKYPIQLWGFLSELAYRLLLNFKVRSIKSLRDLGFDRLAIDHAAGFLGGYTTFPVFDPKLLKTGVFRVLDEKNERDAKVAEADGRWMFGKEQQAEREAYARKVLFELLAKTRGMKLTAETVGDEGRRQAAERAISKAIEQGHDLTLMRALPFEKTPLPEYGKDDRLSLTHDMPALTSLLTGQAGDFKYDWISGKVVGGLLNRFGVLAPGLKEPLKVSELTTEFMMELHRRIISGSNAGTVVMPLASLFTLLSGHLDNGSWQSTNFQPGTTGEVGNPTGNWEQRLPDIEQLAQAATRVKELSARPVRPFGGVEQPQINTFEIGFEAQVKKVAAESVVFRAAKGNWTVWQPKRGQKAVMELAVAYDGGSAEKKFATVIGLGQWGIERGKSYILRDLASGKNYLKSGDELLDKGLLVGLAAATKKAPGADRHHFVAIEQ